MPEVGIVSQEMKKRIDSEILEEAEKKGLCNWKLGDLLERLRSYR